MKYVKDGLRKRQISRFKRIITKNMIVSTIYKTLTPIYHMKVKSQHCLMELTVGDYNRLRKNTINLKEMAMHSGGVRVSNEKSYSNIIFERI